MSVPRTIGSYTIIRQIGAGGMATVYEAYQEKLDRHVAIKWMHATFVQDKQFVARFEREARIVARLDHPNIVPIYDFDSLNGQPYIVMKLFDGQTLKERMVQSPLSLDEIVMIMGSVASALDYAHQQGVLHRDLKPSNILIDSQGIPYLTDFGLARITHQGESTLSADSMLGTPHYISPEQAMGSKELDGRTYVYSFGVLLYEQLVGRLPFTGDTAYAIVHQHIYAAPPPPAQLNPQLTPAVERVLLKALSKDPQDRYPTATVLMTDLKKAMQTTGLDVLDASRFERAKQLADAVPMNTPGGGEYAPSFIRAGRKYIALPDVPKGTPPQRLNLSWHEWITLFIERLKQAIEDIRYQLGNRNIKDRMTGAINELGDSLKQVTAGAVNIQINTPDGHVIAIGQNRKTEGIQAPARTPRRNTRLIQEDWSADEDFVRRRVNGRIKERRNLMGQTVFFVIATIALVALTPTIQIALAETFQSAGFIEAVGAQFASALQPLANFPFALFFGISWVGSLLGGIVQTFYRTGARYERRRHRIDTEMTEAYGRDWHHTVSDAEYRPVRERIRRRSARHLGFIKHGFNATLDSLAVLLVTPIFSQMILNLTQSTLWASLVYLLPILILLGVGIHALIVAILEIVDNGSNERAIRREIAKEKARLGLDIDEKVKNSAYSDKPKRVLHDNSTDDFDVRLTDDGELTDSMVQELYDRPYTENPDMASLDNFRNKR